MKTCTKCQESKPDTEFYRRLRNSDGLNSWCKVCSNKDTATYRKARPDLRRKWDMKYRKLHPQMKRENDKRYALAHPDKRKLLELVYRIRHSERVAARRAVQWRARAGILPLPNTVVCEVCNEALACEWHHHNGYSPEHRLDVIAICKECHIRAHYPASGWTDPEVAYAPD